MSTTLAPALETAHEPVERRIVPAETLVNWFLVLAGLVVWRLFYPALMSYDSIIQYDQAVTHRFADWHPPLMAIVLRFTLGSGAQIGLLMLAQCLAGLFGLRALVVAALDSLFGARISAARAQGIAALVIGFLLLPISPLPFYLMTFWKDSWSAVILLWMCAVSLGLLRESPASPGGRLPWRLVLILLALAAALGMVRHNAVVVLPFVGLVLWAAARRGSRALALTLALAPFAAFLGSEAAVDRIFHIEKVHLERHMMLFDLIGVCALDERACDALPFTRKSIVDPKYAEHYVPGNMAQSFWGATPMIDNGALWYPEELRAEFQRAAWRFPLLFARVKIEPFWRLLGFGAPHMFMYTRLDENKFGLYLNTRFAAPRNRLIQWVSAAGESRILRFISGVHLVWLTANFVWIACLLAASRGGRSPGLRSLALVLLLPLTFYLSYLLAAPAHDYRFMYPATLVLQAVTFAGLCGLAMRRLAPGLPAPTSGP